MGGCSPGAGHGVAASSKSDVYSSTTHCSFCWRDCPPLRAAGLGMPSAGAGMLVPYGRHAISICNARDPGSPHWIGSNIDIATAVGSGAARRWRPRSRGPLFPPAFCWLLNDQHSSWHNHSGAAAGSGVLAAKLGPAGGGAGVQQRCCRHQPCSCWPACSASAACSRYLPAPLGRRHLDCRRIRAGSALIGASGRIWRRRQLRQQEAAGQAEGRARAAGRPLWPSATAVWICDHALGGRCRFHSCPSAPWAPALASRRGSACPLPVTARARPRQAAAHRHSPERERGVQQRMLALPRPGRASLAAPSACRLSAGRPPGPLVHCPLAPSRPCLEWSAGTCHVHTGTADTPPAPSCSFSFLPSVRSFGTHQRPSVCTFSMVLAHCARSRLVASFNEAATPTNEYSAANFLPVLKAGQAQY